MIRVLIYIALLFALAAGFAWLADRPGEIALVWQGYELRTSLMVAAISLAGASTATVFRRSWLGFVPQPASSISETTKAIVFLTVGHLVDERPARRSSIERTASRVESEEITHRRGL